MKIPLADLSRQFRSIEGELREAIERVLTRGDFILGEDVAAFENEFADFCGSGFAIGVSSGTDALILALRALGIGPGDEVVTVPFTFAATVEAIVTVGARPVFVDIDPENAVLDIARLAQAMTPHSKAILPVHLFGFPCNMDAIEEFAHENHLHVVEDASQAHGAEFQGRKTGSFGDAATFSFYPAKNLGAFGDAGAVTTSNSVIADRIRMMRNHGSRTKYRHQALGWNCRLDTLQAAVLRVKLRYLARWNDRRRQIAELYRSLLEEEPDLKLPRPCRSGREVFHYFVVRSPRRDRIREQLLADGIASEIHYPIPLHLQEAFAGLGYRAGEFPVSETWSREVISLPAFPELEDGEVAAIACSIKTALASSR